MLYVLRHGETDANRAGRWQGHADEPLNALGRRQARRCARVLAGETLGAIYSSDLSRARDTARPLAELLGLSIRELPDLREVDVGSWAGRSVAELEAEDPAGIRVLRAGGAPWSDGEDYVALARRAERAALHIAAEHDAHDRVAVFAHGGTVRALVTRAVGAAPLAARLNVGAVSHVALTIVQVPPHGGDWRLLAFNRELPASSASDSDVA